MDAKITKTRVGHLLSYDWIKILAICAAVVVLWVILFTTIAPRATDGQKFEIYIYPRVALKQSVGDLDSLHEKNALSYDVLDLTQNSLLDDSVNTVLSAHFGAGQGDVMFISDYEYEDGTDENGDPVMTSDLKQFVSGYGGNCVWLGESEEYPLGASSNINAQSYLGNCEKYLSKYYPDGLDGEMDKSAVEADFRVRAKGDNRYKRNSQIEAGLLKEYGRIERLREAYNNVMGYLEDGTVSITSFEASVQSEKDENGDGKVDENDVVTKTLKFSFDLSNVPGLEKMITTTRSETGEGTKESVNMVILNTRLQEEALRYEQVTFLDYLVTESARLQALETA